MKFLRHFFPLVLGLFLAAPAPAASPMARYQSAVLGRNRPSAAAAFLGDRDAMTQFRAEDPAGFVTLFQKAAALKDLKDILSADQTISGLHGSLLIRELDKLLDPATLLATIANNPEFAPHRERVADALVEWDTLSSEARTYLQKNDVTEKKWRELRLVDRSLQLLNWAESVILAHDEPAPKTKEALETLRVALRSISGTLPPGRLIQLQNKFHRAKVGMRALRQAAEHLQQNPDAELQSLYDRARAEPNPQQTLVYTSQFFAKAGLSDAAFRAHLPAPKRLNARDAKAVAARLNSRFRDLPHESLAGSMLRDIPLEISVAKTSQAHHLGEYSSSVRKTVIGLDCVEALMTAADWTAEQLRSNSQIMDQLVELLMPIVVHEATHHLQEKRDGVFYNLNDEFEAFIMEAIYLLERERAQPDAFRFARQKNIRKEALPRQSLQLMRTILRRGIDPVQEEVRAMYPRLLSLEARVLRDSNTTWIALLRRLWWLPGAAWLARYLALKAIKRYERQRDALSDTMRRVTERLDALR